MKELLTRVLLTLSVLIFSMFTPGFAAAASSGGCPAPSSSKAQVLSGIGETGNNCSSSGVQKTTSTAVRILSYFVGALAVIMIILAGSKYITSGGDAAKVTNAKSTLIYALVGLALAALAQLLVHYVLSQANSAGT